MAYKTIIYNERKMPPRDGVKFSTTYYDQDKRERKNLKIHISRVYNQIKDLMQKDPSYEQQALAPIDTNRRRDKTYYSMWDIVTDIYEQMNKGNDITKSMIDRWNVVFADHACSIEVINTSDIKDDGPTPFDDLFDTGEE